MREITIQDLFRMACKWILLLVLFPIVVAAGVFVYFSAQPDIYTATTSMFVLIRYEDSMGTIRYDMSTSNYFASDCRALFERSPVMERTAERLELATLKGLVELTVSTVSNTRIVEVNARGRDPVLCAAVANTACEIFMEYLQEFMEADSISIPQKATIPSIPSGPTRVKNTLVAFALALIVSLGFVLLVEMLNAHVNFEQEIREGLGQPLLGVVGDYRKALRAYLEKPAEQNFYEYVSRSVKESVRAIAFNIGLSGMHQSLESIMITSAKAGEGKSSLSLLIASALAEEGRRVLIVDMDSRRPSISRLVKQRNQYDVMDYLMGSASFDDVAKPTRMRRISSIECRRYARPFTKIIGLESFDRFMDEAKARYDMLIFDTPPLDLFIDAAVLAKRVDGVIVVIANGKSDMKTASSTFSQLRKSSAHVVGAVLNLMPSSGRNYRARDYALYETGDTENWLQG